MAPHRGSGSSGVAAWKVVAAIAVVLLLPCIAFSVLRDATGTFRGGLERGGYPSAQITESTVAGLSGRSTKAYDARIQVQEHCLLHLQMKQPGLLGGGFSLVAINGQPVQIDGSPTYDDVLKTAQDKGFNDCKR